MRLPLAVALLAVLILMGAHHHYSSPEGLFAQRPNALSLMGPVVSLISLRFSTLNTLAVRGHAQLYAAP